MTATRPCGDLNPYRDAGRTFVFSSSGSLARWLGVWGGQFGPDTP